VRRPAASNSLDSPQTVVVLKINSDVKLFSRLYVGFQGRQSYNSVSSSASRSSPAAGVTTFVTTSYWKLSVRSLTYEQTRITATPVFCSLSLVSRFRIWPRRGFLQPLTTDEHVEMSNLVFYGMWNNNIIIKYVDRPVVEGRRCTDHSTLLELKQGRISILSNSLSASRPFARHQSSRQSFGVAKADSMSVY
jgi:hypothetical protein